MSDTVLVIEQECNCGLLKPNALLIGNYDVFDQMSGFDKIGYFDSNGIKSRRMKRNIEVQSDSEFFESKTAYGDFVRYSEAMRRVYIKCGRCDNLVLRYRELRQKDPTLKPLPLRAIPYDELTVYRRSA